MAEYSESLDSNPIQLRGLGAQRFVAVAAITGILLLIALQWRSWRTFDWSTFVSEIRTLHWPLLAVALVLSLLTVPLRAIRWQVFLRPACDVKFGDVFSPTVIGLSALALLGRPGELLRPYMIARRSNLTMASQMGVWTVERLFDMGAFAIMAAVAFLFANRIPDLRPFRTAGFITAAVTLALALAAVAASRWRKAIFSWVERRVTLRSSASVAMIAKARSFAEGLNTVKDTRALVEISVLSFGIWGLTALAYVATLRAYPALESASLFTAVLLMGFSMVGGLIQLPAVGGGAQLATIAAMVTIFSFPRELAVSAGIMLWLVSFHVVTPFGLLMARRAHISLSGAFEKIDEAESGAETAPDAQFVNEQRTSLLQCESEG